MMHRLLTIDPDNEPLWVQLDVYPVDNVWAAMFMRMTWSLRSLAS